MAHYGVYRCQFCCELLNDFGFCPNRCRDEPDVSTEELIKELLAEESPTGES